MPIKKLIDLANYKKNQYCKTDKLNFWYHIGMIDAIAKYGYENIPENVVNLINDLHDLKITYAEFEKEFNKL